MGVGKGVGVILLALFWLIAFPVVILIETVRYGLELTLETISDVFDDLRRWRNNL